ncbi:hypothetical protein M2475_000030 [Breznakia sp. PF5-3]|uniref:lactate utilization protein n=1 Tax=unclassified Breznakia TaxID=2623764 RepID=UPI00240631E6|nr:MULTISPECIES: lactate utilization protein [unclassified Breznakia]MDF9823683.1 hypothetical protein [Breznakia sp. PM6-1]MDF9834481.1 hypothetical protein [Breznakia sp. PF5-3]MDF9838488.1 hypothetical protein [Breznakia sp. PFB2-8]MDF9859125.1 hypothetical protein [Breznakia sp. PH5-24]
MNIEKTIQNLEKHNFKAYFVKDKIRLFSLLDQLLKPEVSIGCGDSMTLETLGVYEYLRSGEYIFYDKYKKNLSTEDKRALYVKNFSADVFFSSANAITEDGKIFNIDGNGSRVAPIIYGPKKVIIICGKNKIVADEKAAYKRARNIAAPLDAKRLGKKTPCAITDECVDCQASDRICNSFVLLSGQFVKDRINIIIVDEDLGY